MKKSKALKQIKSNICFLTGMDLNAPSLFDNILKDRYDDNFEFTHSNRYNKSYLWFQSEFDRIKIAVYK